MTTEELDGYARVVLEVGLGLRPGKDVAINAMIEHAPFARALAEQAYARGARYVDLWYWDPHGKASRLRHAPLDTLDETPTWLDARYRELATRQGAQLAKMKRWYSPAEILRTATGTNAALLFKRYEG